MWRNIPAAGVEIDARKKYFVFSRRKIFWFDPYFSVGYSPQGNLHGKCIPSIRIRVILLSKPNGPTNGRILLMAARVSKAPSPPPRKE